MGTSERLKHVGDQPLSKTSPTQCVDSSSTGVANVDVMCRKLHGNAEACPAILGPDGLDSDDPFVTQNNGSSVPLPQQNISESVSSTVSQFVCEKDVDCCGGNVCRQVCIYCRLDVDTLPTLSEEHGITIPANQSFCIPVTKAD